MDIVIIILLILLVNTYIVKALMNNFDIPSERYMWILFMVHYALCTIYILNAFATRSDSFSYFERSFRAENWLDLFKYGTSFIDFLAWPFIKVFSLSYLAVMILFSYFGYLACLIFYITLNENVKLNPIWYNLSMVQIIFLLPNLHFWSSSLGKGSVILFGLSLFTFGLSRFNRRYIPIVIGSIIVFFVRPHIFFTLIASIFAGVLITTSGIKWYVKWTLVTVSLVLFLYFSSTVLKFTNSESLDILSSSNISHRASELSKASSGIDIQNYNLFMKMFAFWFRPLFFDGQGAFGLIVSFENLLTLYFFSFTAFYMFRYWSNFNGWFRISMFIFLTGSFILAQVTGNLGIALRQKAQFMPFLFIIYCQGLSYRQRDKRRLII